MDELVPFLALVIALAVVGVGAGILIARRIDAWDVARNDMTETTDTTETTHGPDEEPDA